MKPYKATIYLYAESEEEVKHFEQVFYDFVNNKREQGLAVTATKLSDAIGKFRNNPFLNNFIR